MANTAQRSFAAGELAPSLYARTDLAKYLAGLRTCRNMLILRQGGATNRGGTEYVGRSPLDSVGRLLPFVFNSSQTYVLEFTHQTLRFIRDGAYIESAGVEYELTTPYSSSDLAALQISQSADVVTIVHASYVTRELRRNADADWDLDAISFVPSIAAPANLTIDPTGISTPTAYRWVVTAIDAVTGEESLVSDLVGTSYINTNPSIRTLSWDAVTGASSYNVYKGSGADGSDLGDYGFIGSTSTLTFYDSGLTPDFEIRPPTGRDPFSASGDYPGAVGAFQQRRIFGGSTNHPERAYTSRTGSLNNFTTSFPTQDDDAITFTLAGRRVNRIVHIIDADGLVILSDGGEWSVGGDQNDILRPTDVRPTQGSEHGASALVPIKTDQRLLFVPAIGAAVRELSRRPDGRLTGSDLTVLSAHLFDGYSLVDWAYQAAPYSIVWAVRSDGVLLGLTIVDDQQLLAWHHHDTDGEVENVCVVPEGREHRLYLIVKRTIDGTERRYIERMALRTFTDVEDLILMDAALTFDGRNAGATTVTLSGGTDWTNDELLTATASASQFSAADVGNEYWLTSDDGTVVRFLVQNYTSATVVTGFASMTVPADLRSAATAEWARAVDELSGLDHLEGKSVSIFADGYVVGSPNNPDVTEFVVTGGEITLDRPHAHIHVGLPVTADLETLDIDTADGPSLKAQSKKTLINEVTVWVERSRGLFAGGAAPDDDGTSGLFEAQVVEDAMDDAPVALATDTVTIPLEGDWGRRGRVFLRQVDPVPLTVLAVIPSGYIPSP